MLPGQEKAVYPWSESLAEALKECWGTDFTRLLPVLWTDMGSGTPALRYDYMDRLTRLVKRCFSGQLGDWCRKKGVKYIGHIIEDNNAHGRLGCSAGHYFRALEGQDMAGVDVVSQQLMPGWKDTVHRWVDGEEDRSSFISVWQSLEALGLRPTRRSRGRRCVNYSVHMAGGGVKLMKWILDHMLVRGINQFVPHAFPLCIRILIVRLNFSAGGKNPQFPFFARLMQYLNRQYPSAPEWAQVDGGRSSVSCRG